MHTEINENNYIKLITTGASKCDHIWYISQKQGLPAKYLLSSGKKITRLFNCDTDLPHPLWRLKPLDDMKQKWELNRKKQHFYLFR